MPQDFPQEASETLAFTPDSLRQIPGAPVFILRAATEREKRFHQRLIIEEGFRAHSITAVRAEILTGLKSLWTEADFDTHAPMIKEYWSARDEFELQKKDDPELKWSYDPEVETAVNDLSQRVSEAWLPLRRMLADNSEYGDAISTLLVAVVVKSLTGLEVVQRLDRGYLTFETAGRIEKALLQFEKQHADAYNLKPGYAVVELFIACSSRMRLDGEEAKNSASPSPSPMNPPPSKETISEEDGKSQASAISSATPESA